MTLLAMFLVFIIIAVLYACMGATTAGKPRCGDDTCQNNESCQSCPQDCSCKDGRHCSNGKCVEAACGNGQCELGENLGNCCDDCGPCQGPGEECNPRTHQCDVPEAPISDERVKELIISYFRGEGKTVEDVTVAGSTLVLGKKAKAAGVRLAGEEVVQLVAVTVDEEVIVYPRT
jgi:hypothetical protein